MAITQNGIIFNNTSKIGTGTAIKLLKNGAAADMSADIADENGGKLPSKVNAVEIDWNRAQLGTTTINTTGELLSH